MYIYIERERDVFVQLFMPSHVGGAVHDGELELLLQRGSSIPVSVLNCSLIRYIILTRIAVVILDNKAGRATEGLGMDDAGKRFRESPLSDPEPEK